MVCHYPPPRQLPPSPTGGQVPVNDVPKEDRACCERSLDSQKSEEMLLVSQPRNILPKYENVTSSDNIKPLGEWGRTNRSNVTSTSTLLGSWTFNVRRKRIAGRVTESKGSSGGGLMVTKKYI